MMLLFDVGNSRAKWAVWSAGTYVRTGSVDPGGAGWELQLQQQMQGIAAPDRILMACVADAKIADAIQRVAHSRWGRDPVRMQAQAMQCGVRNAYAEPAQMGVDRWLAMLAAWNRFRAAVCVCDIGTAITADVVAADGRHLGGIIAPGISLSVGALQAHTAGIRQGHADGSAALGRSTGECVANGCVMGVAGALRLAMELMQRECGSVGITVVTGGDAPRLLPLLPQSCVHVPNLVFDGLVLAAEGQ